VGKNEVFDHYFPEVVTTGPLRHHVPVQPTVLERDATQRRAHAIAVGIVVALAAAVNEIVAYGVFRTVHVGNYDLTIFDQAVRSYSRFGLPVSMIKGVHNNFGPDFTVLGDHFSPVLALLAPLYWIHGGPTTLLLAESVLFGLAVIPLWFLARRELGTVAAYAVSLAYTVAWPLMQASAFPIHEVAFAPLAAAVLFERLSAWRRATEAGARSNDASTRGSGKLWHVLLAAAGLLLVKEDQGFLLAGLGLGILLIAARHRTRPMLLLGLGLVVGGIAYTVFATHVLIPAFGGRADYYWSYDRLGHTPAAVVGHLLSHPIDSFTVLVQPTGIKGPTLLWLAVLGAFAPFGSPYLLAVLPLLAERLLSQSQTWWGTEYQYNAYLVMPLLCAGIDGAARIARRIPQAAASWAVLAVVAGLLSLPHFALGQVSWHRTPTEQAALHAVAKVPDGVLVEAPDRVGPQLTARTQVVMWDRTPLYAPWVIAQINERIFPFCSLEEQEQRVDFLKANGYQEVFREDGYVVLHNAAAKPQLRVPIYPCTQK
jgi:uncharacterized membrane protein